MKIGRVVGTVVSTINSPIYEDRRLLLWNLLDEKGQPTGSYTIGIDVVDAGAGEVVLIIDEGNSARQLLAAPHAPVRTVWVRTRRPTPPWPYEAEKTAEIRIVEVRAFGSLRRSTSAVKSGIDVGRRRRPCVDRGPCRPGGRELRATASPARRRSRTRRAAGRWTPRARP